MYEGDYLLRPDAANLRAGWLKYQQKFKTGVHDFLRGPVSAHHCTAVLKAGLKRQGVAAARHLWLLHPGRCFLLCRASLVAAADGGGDNMKGRAVAVLTLCLALVSPAVANGHVRGSGSGTIAAGLQSFALTPPLPDMKVRWDGKQATSGGMKTFDSPRFGMTRDGGLRAHAGVDLEAPVGTPIFAVADGVVDLARYGDPMLGADILLAFRPSAPILTYLARMGNADDDGVLFAHYAHLSAVFVETGQTVQRGTMIGRTGTSGNADQKYPHLHFEVRKTRWPGVGPAGLRDRIDPEILFQVDFSTPVEAVTRGK